MRDIKFRVWDCKTKKYRTAIESVQLVIRPFTGKCTEGSTTPNVVLEQFTGLYDKNGKEIYEGDIIIEDTNKMKVVGGVRGYCYDCVNLDNGEVNTTLYHLATDHKIEVIRNIHEEVK